MLDDVLVARRRGAVGFQGAGAGPLARLVLMLSVLLGAVGIAVGVLLARWSVRPTIEALEQRERFLVASAHELRSPLASLLAVCESGVAGDEAPEAALPRAESLSRETAERVDGLELTRKLMEDFYTRLWVNEEPKADALWNAKMALRKQGAQTRDWAGWVLVGDPD